jgi:uncharacterized membrane protein
MLAALAWAAMLAIPTLVGPAAAGGTAVEASYLVAAPQQRFFEVGPTLPLVDNGQAQGFPEVFADQSGGIVVTYLEGFYSYWGSPTFTRFNASTGALTDGPFDIMSSVQWDSWGNTTARGAYAALDSQDRLLRVGWGYSFPNASVSVKGVDLAGTTRLAEKSVGTTPYAQSAAAVAVGALDTVHILHYDSAVRYSVMAANGTWLLRNATISNGTSAKYPPQLAYDAPAGRMIASWELNGGGGGVVSAIEPNGSVAWTRAISMPGANLSVVALQDGGVAAVYAGTGKLYALKYDRDGNLKVAPTEIVALAPAARTPRPVALGGNEVLVVWSDVTDGADLDVRAMALNATDFTVTIPPTLVSADDNPSVNPRAAVDRDGGVWVVWQNDTSAYTASVSGAHIFPRWTGYSLETPTGEVTAARGEVASVPVRLENLVATTGEYNFTVTAYPQGGPTNWSGWVEDESGAAVEGVSVSGQAGRDLALRIAAPVVDPAGYAAYVTLSVVDRHRREAPLALTLNVTVVQGHRFEVAPVDQSVAALPGQQAEVTFQVKDNGTLAEVGAALAVSGPPPPGWTAQLSQGAFTALPGETVAVTLAVTPPPGATSTQSYCARLRVQNPNDPFSLTTAGFCVHVALVADPQLTPGSLALVVDPAVAASSLWTLTNVGNAGQGIACYVEVPQQLPAGWSLTGSPAAVRLTGGAAATVPIAVTAPAQAKGGMVLNLTVRGSCEGTSLVHDAPFTVSVRQVHAVNWRTAGTTGDANATGAAVFTVSVENNGNVAEPVLAATESFPQGWVVEARLMVDGAPSNEVPAWSTGVIWVMVQAPAEADAGAEHVVLKFQAGAGTPLSLDFTVRVVKVYGISAAFNLASNSVGAGGVVIIEAAVEHLANVADAYTLRVDVDAPQYYTVVSTYEPASPGDGSSLRGSSLSLDAFSQGTLRVTVTAPRDPMGDRVGVHVTLTNQQGNSARFDGEVRIDLPDLAVIFPDAPLGPQAGPGSMTVRVRVANAGEAAAGEVQVWLRLDGALVGKESVAALGPRTEAVVTFEVNVTEGSRRLEAVVDPREAPGASSIYGTVYERSEDNNTAFTAFTVGPVQAPPAPPKDVSTAAAPSVAWVAAAALAAGVAGLIVLRLRMRRKTR